MMIGAQMSYGLQRDYIADTSLDTLGWQRLLPISVANIMLAAGWILLFR